MHAFQLRGLPASSFAPLFDLSDEELDALRARRVVADEEHSFPCRVSLEDAAIGEELVLVSFEHQPAMSPYRGAGAIYVRKKARTSAVGVGEIPDSIGRRLISVRAYDADGWMRDAEVSPGRELSAQIERMLDDPAVAYLHLHIARRGCFACRVDRA